MCPGTCMHNMLMLFIVTIQQCGTTQGPGVQLKQTHLHTNNEIHHTWANHERQRSLAVMNTITVAPVGLPDS